MSWPNATPTTIAAVAHSKGGKGLYQVEFRVYRRPLKQPLKTHHGEWSDRTGILLRLSDPVGNIGYGEIAPLVWFGTESLEEAIAYCQELSGKIDPEEILSIGDRLPACQFGFESAWEMLTPGNKNYDAEILPCCMLLPAGEKALGEWRSHYEKGDRTFKWKIGVTSCSQELEWFRELVKNIPENTKLRLDANAGLSFADTERWSEACQPFPQVEFLEQPLPPDEFDAMLNLSDRFSTPIALDESVAHVSQLEQCYERGWRGIFVVKAAIAGSPSRLREFCKKPGVDVVWSSVFETAIARHYIKTRLIEALPHHRVPGFGTRAWFADAAHDQSNPLSLWHTLTPV